ncbi:MAG: DUF2231 domain-containing protein [Candidatus Accumulibacter sp. UW20]|jgi:uncharacterized membrane protein
MSPETKTDSPDGLPGVESITSRAAIAGHPLHPMLIHFPVAALLGLVGCDFAWLITDDPFWARAGLWLAGIGAVGGWLASGPGLIDLLLPRVREKITAWCHAILAVMMLSLASLNWTLRYRQDAARLAEWEIYLSLLTAGLIVIAAYLGGRLVYEHAVGVEVGHEAAIEDSSAP